MSSDQKSVFYITGGNMETLVNSPLLEMYKEKNIEVLIMEDEIDELIIPSIQKYKDYNLISVNHSDSVEELKSNEDKANKFADDPELTIRPYFLPKLFDTNFSSFFTFLPSIKDKLSCFKTLITAFISLLSYTALP